MLYDVIGLIFSTNLKVVNLGADRINLTACIVGSSCRIDASEDYSIHFYFTCGIQAKIRRIVVLTDGVVGFCSKLSYGTFLSAKGYSRFPASIFKSNRGSDLEFITWWILLGDCVFERQSCKVAMACIQDRRASIFSEDLHKVGLYFFPVDLAFQIFDETTSFSCSVAGMGNHDSMREFWDAVCT